LFEKMHFADRADAGRCLGRALSRYENAPNVIVLALPRGGVPVGYEIAQALHVPLEVFIVRKLGVPGHEELAMGAVASDGIRVLNPDVITALGTRAMEVVEEETERQLREVARREEQYRGRRPFPELKNKAVILVDDGLATGATMRAAAQAIRRREPARLVIAVPVAAESTCREMQAEADEVVCALTPETFFGVGQFYDDFSQTTDEEVRDLLSRSIHQPPD
jgi:predicted phosphoribosyltransferase